MPILRRLTSVWRSLFQRERLDRDLDDELRFHLDQLVERQIEAGADPETARRAARMEMRGVHSIRQDVRQGRFGHCVETMLADFRYACRGIWRAPGSSLVIVATLAVGIGATTAIFSVVHTMLIAPLPFRDPSQLTLVWSDLTSSGIPRAPLSAPELNDLRERGTLFAGFGAIFLNTARLDGGAEPEQVRVGIVTPDFFSVLGAEPALGQVSFSQAVSNVPSSILLSHAVWQRRYGGDPHIVGRSILMNGTPIIVSGVMPRDFRMFMPADAGVPDDLQAWLPITRMGNPRVQKFLRVVGRMRPGVTLEQARQQVDAIASQISKEFTDYGASGRRFTLVGLHRDSVREMRGPLLALFGGVAILLVIACVNVASVLVARALSRSGETALRMALGAGTFRLFRQYTVEGLVLTSLGAIAGVGLAYGGLQVLLLLAPSSLQRITMARIDLTVLGFASVIALVWGVLCSSAPLSLVRRMHVTATLQQSHTRTTGSRQRTRAGLVAAQLALTVLLLVEAGLLLRTFSRMLDVDPGFRPDGSLTFRLTLTGADNSDEAFNARSRDVHRALLALPGVTGVGAISHVPYDNIPNWAGAYRAENVAEEALAPFADYRAVTPGVMETLGIELIDGRFFNEADDSNGPLAIIVDDLLAHRTWPGQRAVGQRLRVDPRGRGTAANWATVVGTVRHVRHRTPVADLSEQVYFAQRQIQRNPVAYVVRTAGNPADLAGPVRHAIRSVEPQSPIFDMRPLPEYTSGAIAGRRFTTVLATVFAAAALVLACVGVYGVIAYSVSRRQKEFGVRLALGAAPSEVVRLAMRQAMWATLGGLAIGVGAAMVLAPLIQAQLFRVSARDPITYLAAALLLTAAACLASWLPARRAANVSPLDAIRID